MAGQINIGGIVADLDINSGNMERGLASGRQAMAAIEGEVQRLQRDFAQGSIAVTEFNARMQALQATSSDLASRMRAAHAALGVTGNGLDLFSRSAQQASNSAGRMSQAMMQVGYMADDAQYGMAALSNNIAPLVYNLTGNAGLAAAAQIATVAAIQLSKRWDEVREAFGDTTGMQESIRSLEGMSDRLKKLQEDANNFSWGDAFASLLGLSPDAGKARQAADLESVVKVKSKAEAEAKKMEGFEGEAQKKSRERFEQAIGENGGIDGLSQKFGDEDIAKRGSESFLSINKTMGGLGTSNRDEYLGYKETEKTRKLTEQENNRKNDLEQMARQRAIKEARLQIGTAAIDPAEQKRIGDRVGGHAGDVIAGRHDTEKDLKANRKKAADAWKQDAESQKKMAHEATQATKDRERRIADEAEKAVPGLKGVIDRELIRADEAGFQQLNGVLNLDAGAGKDEPHADAIRAVSQRLMAAGMSEADAQDAARKKVKDAAEEDPATKAKRVKNDQLSKAKEALPGVEKSADAAVAKGVINGLGHGELAAKLKEQLMAKGLSDEDAEAAAGQITDASSARIRDKFNNVMGGGEKEGRESSNSEVYGSSDLTNRIQSAISDGGESKKQTSLQEKMLEALTKIANKDPNSEWEVS